MARTLPVAPRPLRWGGVLAYAGLILVASVLDPGPGPTPRLFGVGLSIYLHLVAYAGLTGAIGYARLRADGRSLVLAAGIAVCFGVGVEIVQAPLPYRTASALDVVVNAAGSVVGAALWRTVAQVFGAARRESGTTSI